MKVLAFCFNVIWWRSVAVSMDKSKLVGGRWGGDSMVVGCNKTHQITFFVVTLYIFHVFLKVFIWILNLYFCFYLDDLDIGDFIDDITAIDDITKYLTSYWQTILSPIITTNFLQSFSMGAWGHWIITGLHPSHF